VAVCVDALPCEQGSVRLRIAVEDSGIGIEPQVQKRLFTAFTQADASTTRRFGGTGLGLAISRQLTDLMGGELRLHSVPGAGSVFTLELNFGAAPTDEVPAQLESPRVVRLLVPYRRAREVLTRELVAHGCQVRRVVSVDALLDGEPGELLIVDRAVLGEDTARLGDRLRARGQECLLLVAAFADGDRAALLAEGFSCVLPKPVGSEELALAMNALRRTDSVAPVAVAVADAGAAGALRVLVADDNSVNQRVAMRMLERLGCEVLLADDGLAALQAWREEPLDLVLMDVRMPVMDGLEATASIRAEETLRGPSRVPIVGISANSSSEDERQCRAAGMDDFVPKPIKLQGLEKVIAALVGNGSPRTARRA
jgi:two-component system sensor histidine kinase/response regulator